MRAVWLTALLLLSCAAAQPVVKPAPAIPDTHTLRGPIDDTSSNAIISWVRATKAKQPVLFIDSLGGEIEASIRAADAVWAHGNVRCIVQNKAVSGAFAVLQSCKDRVMESDALLITHEPRVILNRPVTRGELTDILARVNESAVAWNKRCRARLNISKSKYDENVREADWIMGAAEALAVSAVDAVIVVKPLNPQ